MKKLFMSLIIVLGIYGFTSMISPTVYVNYYVLIVVIPFMIILVKKNLFKGVFILLLLLIFQNVPWIQLRGLPDIAPYRLLWLMILFIILFELIIRQRKLIGGIARIQVTMVLFCIYAMFSMAYYGLLFREGQGNFLMNYVIPFTMFFIAIALITNEKEIRKVFIFFSILGFYLGFTGICEYLKLDFLIFPSYIADSKRGIHYGMARGPFLETSQNGVVVGMLLFIAVCTFLQSHNKLLKIFAGIAIPLLMCTLIFSFNRASWVGVAFASLIFPIFYPQIRKFFIVLLLALVIIVGAFQIGMVELPVKKDVTSSSSFGGRLIQYDAAWRMFIDKPVLGYGYNNHMHHIYKYYRFLKGLPNIHWEHAQFKHATIHNVLLNMLLQLGLIGTGLYIYLMYCIIAISVRLYKLLPADGFEGKGIVIAYWGICSTFFMKYMFTEWKTEMFPIVFFFMISGIIVGLYQRTLLKTKNENGAMHVDSPINVPV